MSVLEYSVKKIEADDKEDVLKFLRRTFFVTEPINAAFNLSEDPLACQDMESYYPSALLSNYSLKAVDDQGTIVGVMLNHVASLDGGGEKYLLDAAERCKTETFRQVLMFSAMREKDANLAQRYPGVDKLMHIRVAATEPAWQKRGIMKALLTETEKMARADNIRLLRMDTSSQYSWLAAASAGFECVSALHYTDYKINGEVFIKTEPPHLVDRVNFKMFS